MSEPPPATRQHACGCPTQLRQPAERSAPRGHGERRGYCPGGHCPVGGVAVGTLYRHFPTRQDLLEAVFCGRDRGLAGAGRRTRRRPGLGRPGALAPSPAGLRGAGTDMGAAVLADKHLPGTRIYAANKAMHAAGDILLRRAQAAGQIRPDVHILDVIRLVYGIAMVNEHASDPEGQPHAHLVVAGIRTTPGQD